MIDAVKQGAKRIPVVFICRHFGVARSSYYAWQKRDKPIRLVRKEEICKAIKESFSASQGTFGSPRICDDLREQGFQVSENTVAKYMQEMGLDARLKKKFRIPISRCRH